MIIVDVKDIKGTDRQVVCPKGGFISNRIILESDGMGYTMTKTEIPKGDWQHWHYKKHLESCYCVSGTGILKELTNGIEHKIKPGITYILNNHDDHEFKAIEDVVLICVFNPPLKGNEVHLDDGSYQ